MVNGDRFVLIDWVNSGIGNPMYDIAEYVLLTTQSTAPMPDNTPPKLIEFIDLYKPSIIPAFLEEYEKLSGHNVSDYEKWYVPLYVSKLNSNRSIEEKYKILEKIRKRLN